jgi:hypothetical protein
VGKMALSLSKLFENRFAKLTSGEWNPLPSLFFALRNFFFLGCACTSVLTSHRARKRTAAFQSAGRIETKKSPWKVERSSEVTNAISLCCIHSQTSKKIGTWHWRKRDHWRTASAN